MNVIRAIFQRNFLSYFSNPTGYVFICVFVLLGSLAAFWPNEFFNANLANLDQLNKYLPYILLIFIPAITMSIWADERRLGTDELLLTIPASDFQVVLGKYLAAVAIYSVSLLFSLFCNLIVLTALGSPEISMIQFPDMGLLFGTYFGYWIVGMAMLAIGMAASFLTGNLTVSFILGVAFNAPLAFAWALPGDMGLARWSITDQFRDFGRGVISLSSVTYFLSLVAVMLYLSMVLIGRRHWRGGADGNSMAWHYLARFVAAMVIVLGINVFFTHHDKVRLDVTTERLSSLSPQTREIMKKLDLKYPIHIDAFISPDNASFPENYVQTRLNLISTLREFQAMGRDKVTVDIINTEPLSKEAQRAEQQYGIRPQAVETKTRGARKIEEIFMGVAFNSGTNKVVVPFFGRGIPVEYEVIRSVATVAQQKRKKIGVLQTDAKLFGGFDMQTMSSTPDQLIIDELKKQYDVVQVDPTNPIAGNFDVLLAVQPSSLGPQQMENFIAAVKSGQPTAIFEDPFPYFNPEVPGTSAPKQPAGGQNPFMMGRQPPQPKGDIKPLWDFLGVDFRGDRVVWQDYNPYPKATFVTREWVFADEASGAKDPFNSQDPIVSKLQQVLMLFPGAVEPKNATELDFHNLITTSKKTGTVKSDEIMERSMMGGARMNPELPLLEKPTGESYVLAARIQGKPKTKPVPMSDKEPADDAAVDPAAEAEPPATDEAAKPAADEAAGAGEAAPAQESTPPGDKAAPAAAPADSAHGEMPHDAIHAGLTKKGAGKNGDGKNEAAPQDRDVNVVVVADIDCLYSAFFALRARGEETDSEDAIDFDFDNVTFVLNALDALAGDESFVEIRKRRPYHHTLERVSRATEEAKSEVNDKREASNKEFNKAKAEEQKKFDDQIAALKKRTGLNPQQALTEIMMAQQTGQRRLEAKTMQLKQERDTEIKKIEREANLEVRKQQDWFKLLAVLLPPIPPLLVGLVVFFNRRAREKEGVSKARLR